MKNTLATETPVTDGDALFVYFGNLGVFCLDAADGGLRWSHDVAPAATRLGWGTAASPVLHDGRLYLVNDNDDQSYLLALSAETGNEVWRIPRDEGTNWATPFIWENEQRTEIVTNGTDRVRSYDLDGNLLWELTGMSSITVATPFAEFGLLYIGSGYLGDQNRPVFAVRPARAATSRSATPRQPTSSSHGRSRRPPRTTRPRSSTATSCTRSSTGASSPPTTRGPARRSTPGNGSRSARRSPPRPGPTATGSSRSARTATPT